MKEVSRCAFPLCLLLMAWAIPRAGLAQEANSTTPADDLATSIDSWVQTATAAQPASVEQDAMLLRKLYLTLIGLVPTLDETNLYLADASSDRYARTVEQLMSRPEFVEHWAEKFDVMLMERRANTHVPQDQWTAWLRAQIAANRPLNHWLADLLVADGAPGDGRAAARFLLDRAGDANLITNDLGRIYFGRDIQCSQCHNHPSIDSYRQSDYQGLFGFVSGLHLVEVADGDKKVQMLAEKSANDSPFESVFHRGTMHRVLPHLFEADELPQPWTIPGEDYHPADAGRPAKPIHSRRQQLADAIRVGNVEHFNRNLSNRLWAMVFGRGVVEPVDLHHADNPPLSEELLDGLAKQLASMRFDLKSFVRQLVTTRTFKLGQLEVDNSGQQAPVWLEAALQSSAELLQRSQSESTALREQKATAESQFNQALDDSASLRTERLTAFGNVDKARAAVAQAVEAVKKANTEKQAAEQAQAVVADKLAKLQAAADSSAAALQAVGQDAELAAAVELIKNRMAAVQPTLEPLQKSTADKTAAAQAAVDGHSKAREALLAAQASASEVDARYRVAATKTNQKRLALQEVTRQLANAELLVNHLTTLSKWNEHFHQAAAIAQKLDEEQKSLEPIQVGLTGLIASRQAAEQKLPEMLAGAEAMAGEVNAKRQQVESVATKIKRVADAKAALSSTAELLKAPEKISPTLEELDLAAAGLLDELKVAEQQLAEVTAANVSRQNELDQLKQTLAQLQQQVAEAENRIAERRQQRTAMEGQLASVRQQQASLLKSVEQWLSQRFVASRLRPLSPEQIGWSFLAVTNVYKNYVDKHMAEIEKATPATPEQLQDVAFMAARRSEAVRKARAELQGNINHFITLYGAGPGQPQNDFFATPDQALYASNGGAIFAWAAASGENVTAKVVAAGSSSEAAEKLFLGVLSRQPTQAEASAVEQYLAQQPDIRARLAQELVWSLLASAEFRFMP